MGQPAARITDMHVCALVTGIVPHVGGPISTGMPTVITGGMPQARVTDICVCVGPPDMIVKGSPTVLVGGLMAARIGDLTVHGGSIVTGFPTVLIGETGPGGGGGGGGGTGDGQVSITLATSGPGLESPVRQAKTLIAVAIAVELATSGPGLESAVSQAKALTDAAKAGTPFCERCAAAARAAAMAARG